MFQRISICVLERRRKCFSFFKSKNSPGGFFEKTFYRWKEGDEMSQIIDYPQDSSLENTDAFLIDGNEGTRTVTYSALISELKTAFGFTVLSNADLNDISDGFYCVYNSCTNKPQHLIDVQLGGMIFQKSLNNGTYKRQLFIGYDGTMFYRKSDNGTTWTAWAYPYTDMKSFELNGTTLTITDTM